MARSRRVLTAVVAIGMILGLAAVPASARRGAEYTGEDHGIGAGAGHSSGGYAESPGAGGSEGHGSEGHMADKGEKGAHDAKEAHDNAAVAGVCERLFGSKPTGDLEKESNPLPGSTLLPGQKIDIDLTWDRRMFFGARLHAVAVCVSVDDEVAPELSVVASDAGNSGAFIHDYTVPEDARPGSEICDQAVIVSRKGPDDQHVRKFKFTRAVSSHECYTVGPPAVAPAAPPPPEITPAPPEITPVLLPTPPPQVLPAVETRPAPAQLPRTGPSRALLLLAGIALLLGGLGVIAGAQARPLPQRARR